MGWTKGEDFLITVSGSAVDRLGHIKHISGVSTLKQVFMNALATYQALKEQPPGTEVFIEYADGTRARLVLP